MPYVMQYSNIAGTTQAGQLPEVLQSVKLQLEGIRQEQLAKNRSRLQGLASEQQQCLERLTLAIIWRIFGEVASEWESCAAAGNAGQISEILSRLWGAVDLTAVTSQTVARELDKQYLKATEFSHRGRANSGIHTSVSH